ncbi:hypothetical protein PsorP6_011008 [Peronosclerospora sorghi]|uniref:Uncharacterized protein n=1 Tax=Peronosclerospora sorghi TaxID=230839 RepID=A0ACC0VTL6_9STRA|nr:hypothetical protein PsorP6_011008 [Peronosclerospora sorghi]
MELKGYEHKATHSLAKMKFTNEGLPEDCDDKNCKDYKIPMHTVFWEKGLMQVINGAVKRE